jgi:hypothetical protein
MAIRFVASGGSNTSPYETWAKAATSLATALAASTSAGDVIVIQYDAVPAADNAIAADTTYTFAGNISLVSASNDGGSAYTLTAMDGTTNFIGTSGATSYNIIFAGADRSVLVYGIALRIAGSSVKEFRLASSAGMSVTYDNCYFWLGTSAASNLALTSSFEANTSFYACTFRFGSASQYLTAAGRSDLVTCSLSSSGSAPTIALVASYSGTRGHVECIGCNWSHAASTIVGNNGNRFEAVFDRCTFGSGATLFAAQTTNPTEASSNAFFSDCLVGTSRIWGHYNAMGSAIRETGIYYTTSEAGAESWKVVTTANASYRMPYCSPWIDWHNTGTSAITPRMEILRDGSATAYTDAQIWAEFSWKNTASSPLASGLQDDWQGMAAAIAGTAGTDQAAGAGTGSWTGEGGTAWSGKTDSGSSITPTEAGALRGRVVVAAASITVYVDPVIRT